jgi:phosphoglycolate phosphatase
VRNLLVLWDVDYTLITAGGVGKHLYELVFRDMFARDMPSMAPVDGRTERAIIADTLAGAGIAEPHRHVDDFLGRMAARAPALADLARERVRVLPGAAAALAALAAVGAALAEAPAQTVVGSAIQTPSGPLDQGLPRLSDQPSPGRLDPAVLVVQSVLTGNMRILAEVKIRAPGLASYLDLGVGAFGDQHAVRSELVHIARRNASHAYGHAFAGQETVLVGDTPLDVAAALTTGARAVGVATGRSTAAQLTAAGAHAVLPDLTDTAAVVSAILGSEP